MVRGLKDTDGAAHSRIDLATVVVNTGLQETHAECIIVELKERGFRLSNWSIIESNHVAEAAIFIAK